MNALHVYKQANIIEKMKESFYNAQMRHCKKYKSFILNNNLLALDEVGKILRPNHPFLRAME